MACRRAWRSLKPRSSDTWTLVRYTLKTNYFVQEKPSLAFRLDPAYLDTLDPEFVKDRR